MISLIGIMYKLAWLSLSLELISISGLEFLDQKSLEDNDATGQCTSLDTCDGNDNTEPIGDNNDSDVENCSTSLDNSCSMYYAPSTIPNSGFGVYTTRPISLNCPVATRPEGASVILTDFGEEDFANCIHMNYVWDVGEHGTMESGWSSKSVMNIGSLANHHSYVNNVQPPLEHYDDTVTNRLTNPGAGAYSYYSQRSFTATDSIEAGQELFLDYGTDWMETHGFDNVMRSVDYILAKKLLETIVPIIKRDVKGIDVEDITFTVNNVLSLMHADEDLEIRKIISDFNKVKDEICPEPDDVEIKASVANARLIAIKETTNLVNSRLASILPTTIEDFELILQLNKKYANYGKSLAFYQSPRRTNQWIKENGFCLENIESKISTMPHAGQGAFATRFLSKGSMVIPSPLNQMLNRTDLATYRHEYICNDNEMEGVSVGDATGKQLILNYCFSHKDTSLLLCPSTYATLINHCGKKVTGSGTCDDRGPNAEIRWSGSWDPSTSKWLKMSMEEIIEYTHQRHRGLSFDIIATRDILPGEEVFIDYGSEWEDAWETHLSTWQPPKEGSGFESFSSVVDMNKEEFIPRTKEELEQNPYGKNILTLCYYYEKEYDYNEIDYLDSTPLEQLIRDFTYVWTKEYSTEEHLRRCEVISRDEESSTFLIRLLGPGSIACEDEIKYDSNIHEPVFLDYFPRDHIYFVSETYKSDQHLPNAFRHHIGLRDNMLPDQWRNIA